jgi:hypothetical protein
MFGRQLDWTCEAMVQNQACYVSHKLTIYYPFSALVNVYNSHSFCNDYVDDDYDEEQAKMSAANMKTAVFYVRFLLSSCHLLAGPSVHATNTNLNSDLLPQTYAIPGTRWKSST